VREGLNISCPRCRNSMSLVVESESSSRERRVAYLYICPVCRYRVPQEEMLVKFNGGKIELTRRIYRKTLQ